MSFDNNVIVFSRGRKGNVEIASGDRIRIGLIFLSFDTINGSRIDEQEVRK
jgi:hypothetical protein